MNASSSMMAHAVWITALIQALIVLVHAMGRAQDHTSDVRKIGVFPYMTVPADTHAGSHCVLIRDASVVQVSPWILFVHNMQIWVVQRALALPDFS